jgi:hypothetical protein
MSQPPFGDPGVCPTIALFSLSTNQSPIGGSLSTTSFLLRYSQNLLSLALPWSKVFNPNAMTYEF